MPMTELKSRSVAEALRRGVAFRVLARTLSGPRTGATSFVYHNGDALSRATLIDVAHSMGLQRAQGSRSQNANQTNASPVEQLTRGMVERNAAPLRIGSSDNSGDTSIHGSDHFGSFFLESDVSLATLTAHW
jgi:hypothetical protein